MRFTRYLALAAIACLLPLHAHAGDCKVEDWRFLDFSTSTPRIKIEGTTTCEKGHITIRAYDGSGKYIGNDNTFIRGHAFNAYIEGQVPKDMSIKYTIE